MVAVRDFSGLAISAWALASAVARPPIVSLDRCIGRSSPEQVKTDGAGLRALGPDAMTHGFPGVFRDQLLQIGFGGFVFGKRRARPLVDGREIRPGIGCGHIRDPDRLDSRAWRLDIKEVRGFSRLDATPKLLFGHQQEVLVEWIRLDFDLHPLSS